MPELESSIELLRRLIAFPTISSTSNADISDHVAAELTSRGFSVQRESFLDDTGVQKVNLVARRDPSTAKPISQDSTSGNGLAYFCHTDVVPVSRWTGPGGDPFDAVIDSDRIYGRGSCDMKGSLVAMLEAAAQVDQADQTAPLWIVCTADEETGFLGAKYLRANSAAYQEIVQLQPMAIIGEPTKLSVVHAHKGITGFTVTSHGLAAHSSLAIGVNANEAMVPMLQTILELGQRTKTDARYQDDRFSPPTLSWTFGVSDESAAINITPARSKAWVSLRTMPEIDGEDLIAVVQERAADLGLEFKRYDGGGPVFIDPDSQCVQVMCELAGGEPSTVCYGTDGGEFNQLNQMVVCGPGDIAQAHTTDEFLETRQLEQGIGLYRKAIERWCTASAGT